MTKDAAEFAPWLGVFETLRVVDGVPLFMRQHREELARAMEALELTSDFDFEKARAELPRSSGRWRWLVTPEGTRTFFSEEKQALAVPIALSVSSMRVGSCNWDARFKTVSYLTHVQAAKTAQTPEAILLNEHGQIASASRGNLFWRVGGELRTPSCECGCRRGVIRRFVLERRQVKIGQFRPAELIDATEIFLTNSMKGIVSVNRFGTRSLNDFSMAAMLRVEYEAAVAEQVRG